MDRQDFYTKLSSFLLDLKPERAVAAPEPRTHLWTEGYLDSIGMFELLLFLEDMMGREIEIGPEMFGSFNSMEMIYDTHVAA